MTKVALFDCHSFEKPIFDSLNSEYGYELKYFDAKLTEENARLAAEYPVIAAFAHDCLNEKVLKTLASGATRFIALRSAGFNHVNLVAARELGIRVARVPAYSPNAVAEHAIALILALNRRICRASARVHDLNFSLDGLVGFDLHRKTVGIVGTGKIGSVFAKIMHGFGCKIFAYDQKPDDELVKNYDVTYTALDTLFRNSDIISLHVPLNSKTEHLVNSTAMASMKPGVMLINTGRGALIDTKSLIANLKNGRIGFAGLDVYEEEENVFFSDLSNQVLQDDVLARLLTFPNVLITAHQAFLTREALHQIVETTLKNIHEFESGAKLENEISAN